MLTNQPRTWHVRTALDHIAGREVLRTTVSRLITRPWLYSIVLLLLAFSRVAAACVDPSALVQSTASITRNFSEEEQKADPNVLGISGTGWFLSPGSMATVAHVAEAMHLSGTDWKQIEIWDGQSTQSIPARILRVMGSQPERIAVLELRNPFPRAQVLPIRMEPLVPDERVVSVACPFAIETRGRAWVNLYSPDKKSCRQSRASRPAAICWEFINASACGIEPATSSRRVLGSNPNTELNRFRGFRIP